MNPEGLKVLHLIASSDLGGAEKTFLTLAMGQRERNLEVYIACPPDGPMLGAYKSVAVELKPLELRDIFNAPSILSLVAFIREKKIQILHTHMWTADVLGIMAGKLAKVPATIATVRGYYFTSVDDTGLRALRKRGLSWSFRIPYLFFDRVIAVSRAVRDDLTSRPGVRVKADKVRVIYNALDMRSFESTLDRTRMRDKLGLTKTGLIVTVVANFFPIKGHRYLVDAIPKVLSEIPSAHFLLVGDGPCRQQIEETIAKSGMQRSVLFTGSRSDVGALIAASDLIVLPSLWEGFPLTLLEALAAGKPIVATRVGGIPEIIHDGETGILVPAGDPDALAAAIQRVLAKREWAQQMGELGREQLRRKLKLEDMILETEAVYQEALKEKVGNPNAHS